MGYDPEYAYKRCLEIMTDIEAEARERLGGRVFTQRTAWQYPRKVVEAHMYLKLYGVDARDYVLEGAICELLDPMCNISTNPVQSRPAYRSGVLRRGGDIEQPLVYTPDGAVTVRGEAAASHDADEITDIVPFLQ